jgi:hypothetical protein
MEKIPHQAPFAIQRRHLSRKAMVRGLLDITPGRGGQISPSKKQYF